MQAYTQTENNDILHRRSTSFPITLSEVTGLSIEQYTEQSSSTILIHNNLILENSIPKHINIRVNSAKGVSNAITQKEIDVLTEIFGYFDMIHFHNLHYLNTCTKIIIQDYISNCWWIGILNNIDGNKIVLDSTIYIQRSNGKIYNTSPSTRQVICNIFDSFFIIKH